jgi:hypothetical protein
LTRPFALALAAAALLLGLAAPAQARVPAAWVGVMADGPLFGAQADLGHETRLMRSAGVGSVRVAFYWRSMQPEAGAPVDWAETDRIVAANATARLRTLPVLVRAPLWATAGGDGREGARPDPAAYGRWVGEVVRRYGPRGTFWAERPDVRPMHVRQWQVWNEPDITRYLIPAPGRSWAATYVPILRAGYRAIKAADRGATVIAAGLTNRSWVDLRRLYAAGGRRWFDAAAIHPFSRRPSNVVKIVRLARQEMRRRGDARKPLMLTEVSWSSGQGRSTFNYGWETTERGQAERVRQALRALARERTRLRIGGVWWYTWLSPEPGDAESFSYAGLRHLRDGRAVSKPAYGAFRTTVRQLRSR